jgi:Smr domain
MTVPNNIEDHVQIDLHGHHPSDINIPDLLKQASETGASEVTFIHGHGRNRGITPGFVNTNTGYLGLSVRRAIRRNADLKRWVKISTLDCTQAGATTVKLRPNSHPTRTEVELPEPRFAR